jgi:hypothetical protein
LIFKKLFYKFFYVYLSLEKLVNGKYFPVKKNIFQSKENLAWFLEKCFPFILDGKHFPEVVKNLEMSYYLLIISNLVLKLLIAIYILFWIFVFQFHPLKFNFYINFNPHFYDCYFLFLYHFLIEIFYLSNLILIFFILIVTYFIWNNLWHVNYYYFNFFIFQFFNFLDLISIILIIIYFIWDNL